VKDPAGREITAGFFITGKESTAIIEMADASGLRLLQPGEKNPMLTSSFGTGQLMKAALDNHVKKIILCIGGSATVDGGCGILAALGVVFLDKNGKELQPIPADLLHLHAVDISSLDVRLKHTPVQILCDVKNPLAGSNGAAAVFGPQKGADTDAVTLLENMLQNFSALTESTTGKDIRSVTGGGAAGGTAAGLFGIIDAQLFSGIDYFLSLTDFDTALQKADHVITAEGSIDRQTLEGKGPAGVAVRAKQKCIPVTGFTGMPAPRDGFQELFDEIICINPPGIDPEEAMRSTYQHLMHAAKDWGNNVANA
jgi:glycerate kinase